MKPSLNTRASTSRAPQTSAVRLAHATHSGVYGLRPATPSPASPAASTAAVAESAPTTRSFDEPSSPKTRVGKMMV